MQDEVEALLRESFLLEAEKALVLIRTRACRPDQLLGHMLLRIGDMKVLGLITLDEASALKRRANEALLNI